MTRAPDWSPSSWQSRPAAQQPKYPDQAALQEALACVKRLPPIVMSSEVHELRRQLAEVARGERFLIQGGDCSERFEECTARRIYSKVRLFLQMSLVLLDASKMKLLRIGRMAGQYAKPRSSLIETRDGVMLPAYQGDIINRPGFTEEERTPNPRHLIDGHHHSAATLNFIRGLTAGDFANFTAAEYWNLDFAERSPNAAMYHTIAARIGDSLRFMEAATGGSMRRLTRLEFFTSHEGLHLPYEEANTMIPVARPGWHNLGAHFLWIGDRTRALDGAHVEYFRGIENPIGVKIGNTIRPDELVELVRVLNPANEAGKLTLIHRFGARRIDASLPPLVEAITRAGAQVVWACDPMHGNTTTTASGIKTRSFDDILDEVRKAFELHHRLGTFLGGVHFEMTGEDVTECTGGARALTDEDLKHAYASLVDPRLNYEQTIEMAFQVGEVMQKWRGRGGS
jgi:3-deoxy-7-phosphoheptulonate synthase